MMRLTGADNGAGRGAAQTDSNDGHLQKIYLGTEKGNQFRIYDRAEKRETKGQNWVAGECTRDERILQWQKIKPAGVGGNE